MSRTQCPSQSDHSSCFLYIQSIAHDRPERWSQVAMVIEVRHMVQSCNTAATGQQVNLIILYNINHVTAAKQTPHLISEVQRLC